MRVFLRSLSIHVNFVALSGQNRQKKQSEGVRFHIVENTLLQTAFSAILPTEIELC